MYHFRTATGQTCCHTSDPKNLCSTCRARLTHSGSDVPPPPSLVTAIQEADPSAYRATTPPRLAASLMEHSRHTALADWFAAQSRPVADVTTPRSAEASSPVPEPPSLITAIQERNRR